ncbi:MULTISPECIES: flavodoxin family protein [Bacillota]|jgi:multimeric flavodoxin WrbA|uniref:Flavodoxin family protein n=2 Tax=Amedibacillus TaxID=2749846 RepID=A0A7G9GST0_9FIRM|nr:MULTISPECIES: flavodoxin family protein [Bacillota]QNM13862.1 flavodoxin family protein [[Eubacterium] hominis]MCH4283888.1 flavodoxin family protein [Amedibacillus hominis]RGB56774.1 flavodoxin family protein [Absiella sp. AM22-9]RGB60785.1 flavodoxin family protein [Absiella sp. AM10-20]RGB69189.1 flavodoxin family protein [Absiella sp. AM09-45]
MKVILFNGSPNIHGCTYTALHEIEETLQKNGIETEVFQVGSKNVRGCIGCGKCRESGKCIFDDIVNEAIDKIKEADGVVFGSPVYYASANGTMISFLDRLFYAASQHLAYKPGAVVVSARRAGTTATYDELNKYLGISNMLIVPAPYWNMVHGNTAEEVKQDREGLYIMRQIGENMTWMLKMLENAKANGIAPAILEKERTNFIR